MGTGPSIGLELIPGFPGCIGSVSCSGCTVGCCPTNNGLDRAVEAQIG